MRGGRWELWGELFTQRWFVLCWFEILVQPRVLHRQLRQNPLFYGNKRLLCCSTVPSSQRCLALCGEAFHVSGTATERNHGIPEPCLEWSSGDPLFQPAEQAAPLSLGCSGLWLEHAEGRTLWAACSGI